MTAEPPPETPTWWEDPDLAAAVAEVEAFAADAGWDSPPQVFALVETAALIRAEPGLAATLGEAGTFTALGQEALPAGDLSEALAGISWPGEVVGAVLVQEIVVLPPADSDAADGADAARIPGTVAITDTAESAAADPRRHEARLVAGVLRGRPGGACLLRVRPRPDTPSGPDTLRGGDLAPNLLAALAQTFLD